MCFLCCCCCFPRCFILFACGYCLVQSIIWFILAAIAISVYECDYPVEFDVNNPGHYVYFIYFLNRDCASIPDELNLERILGNSTTLPPVIPPGISTTTPFPPPQWPDRFEQVDYTNTLMWVYVVFNGAWAVTCVIAIVAAFLRIKSWFAYLPWILLAAANIVLDIVATVNFVIDATDSETPQGLLETVIGLDLSYIPVEYKSYINKLYEIDMLQQLEGLTMIPSVVMLALACRLGILWVLNVLFLICVPFSVYRLGNKKGKSQHLATYPHTGPVNRGLENRAYLEEPHTKEPGYDYTDGRIHNGPNIRGDLNTGLASSFTLPRTHLHSPPTQSNYLELRHPQHRHHEPSAPADNYGWQAHNGMHLPNYRNGGNGADEQISAPNIRRTDYEISSQPPTRNRLAGGIALPRVGLYPPAAKTDAKYLYPRLGPHNFLDSTYNYKPPSSPGLSAPHDVWADYEPDGQRKAPHFHRADSNNSLYRPPVPPRNLMR